MSVAALGLELGLFAASVTWRSWRQWCRTGDAGFRLGRVRRPAARGASTLMTPGFVASVAAPIVDLAHGFGLVPALDHPVPRFAGLGLMAMGIAVIVGSQLALRDSWRIGVDDTERTELVVDGAFALSRNPIFTGMVVTAIGGALAAPNGLGLVAPVLVLAGVQLQVRWLEGPYLLSVHGDSYRRYCARVGRFFPGVGRGVATPSGRPTDTASA